MHTERELEGLDGQPGRNEGNESSSLSSWIRDESRASLRGGWGKELTRLNARLVESNVLPDLAVCGDKTEGKAGVGYYYGEGLEHELEPRIYIAGEQDSLESVARTFLGAGATRQEVEKYAREIGAVNGGIDRVVLRQTLLLPGHTGDGGFVVRYEDGSEITRWADGTERSKEPDGTGYVKKPGQCGAYTEKRWGPRQEDNYELIRTADGRYLIREQGSEKALDKTDANPPDVRVESARLDGWAEKLLLQGRISAEDFNLFRQNMKRFNERAHELGSEEVAKTYKEVSRLLSGEDSWNARLGKYEQRFEFAAKLVSHAADPSTIRWRDYPDAVYWRRWYGRSPSDAVKAVVDYQLK